MTLRRVRVQLSNRTAATPGIGFVAVTRVKHPWDLVFEEDLPEWEEFQKAQWKPAFRQRRRYELRMSAKASRTIRRYRCCAADPWTEEEAQVADRLLRQLAVEGSLRRSAARLHAHQDPDALIWGSEEIPYEDLLLKAAREVAAGDEAFQKVCIAVSARLLGVYHLPAVQEALGCLIPPELDPKQDGKKPKGKQLSADVPSGVTLDAGGWKVDVVEEQALAECRLSKGVIEFFLLILRNVCRKLKLPVALGSQKLGDF